MRRFIQKITLEAISVAGMAGFASASPIADRADAFVVQVSFSPVNGGGYTLGIPTGKPFLLVDPNEIAVVYSVGGATCAFYGAEGFYGTITGEGSLEVLPQQVLSNVSCSAL